MTASALVPTSVTDPRPGLASVSDYTPPTLAEQVANDFLFSYRNINTRTNYTQGLRAWFQWCLGQGMDPLTGYDGAGIRRSDVERFLRWSEEVQGLARRTSAGRYSAVKGFFRRAIMDGHITIDPCAFVKSPPVERKSTTNGVTKVELGRIIAKAKEHSPRDYALFCVLGYNGFRVSEVVGIDIEDVARDRAYYTVRIIRKGGATDIQTLAQETAYAILEYAGERKSGPLFLSLRTPDKRMTRADVQGMVKRYARWCGIVRRISPHSFRHGYVTISLNAGVAARDVQRGTGHRDPRMVPYYDRGNTNRANDATHIVAAEVNEIL
jgi:integrase/recombinase XerD